MHDHIPVNDRDSLLSWNTLYTGYKLSQAVATSLNSQLSHKCTAYDYKA